MQGRSDERRSRQVPISAALSLNVMNVAHRGLIVERNEVLAVTQCVRDPVSNLLAVSKEVQVGVSGVRQVNGEVLVRSVRGRGGGSFRHGQHALEASCLIRRAFRLKYS